MSEASKFLDALPNRDSNTVNAAVVAAKEDGIVEENQDWDNERSTWAFSDGSAIVMHNADVSVEDAPTES